jgi:hypothetical protein
MKTAGFHPGQLLSKGIYAIAGLSKNAGKTSFLNYLVANLSDQRLGVLTTGRDGEEKDEVFGNPKPPLKLKTGTLFTAAAPALEKQGSAIRVLEKLPYSLGTGPLWLLETLRDVETEITGPATAAAQIQVAEHMLAQDAELVLIDGSLDRKSIALRPEVQGIFLVAGSSYGNLEKINSELSRLLRLSGLPVYPNKKIPGPDHLIALLHKGRWQTTTFTSLLGNEQEISDLLLTSHPDGIYLPGALTDSVLLSLKPALKAIKTVVVRHPLHLHLSPANLDFLLSTRRLFCLQPFTIIALVLNSWSVKGNHLDSNKFRASIRQQYPSLPVLDICEQ